MSSVHSNAFNYKLLAKFHEWRTIQEMKNNSGNEEQFKKNKMNLITNLFILNVQKMEKVFEIWNIQSQN